MLNVKRKKKLRTLLVVIPLAILTFLIHRFLSTVLVVYPNLGISFGWSGKFLVLISGLLLMVIWVVSWQQASMPLMMVAVGGTINFVDRMFFGYVRDYWDLMFIYNNLADWIVVLGVIYFIFDLWQRS